ncbi:hypothetical protein EMCRGX_G005698 [Ephydatia muelleri]
MVALFGSVGELNEEKEEWQLCVKRMEHYMNTNEIQDERVMKYKQVLEQMAQHYCPKRSVIVERYTFHSHLRWKEEPIVAFVVKLREMTQTYATVTGKVQHIHRLMQMLGNKDSRRASCSLFSNCKGDICKSPRLACCHLLQDQPYSQTAHSCLQEQDSYLRPRRLYVQCQHEKKNRLYMHMYTYPDLLPSLPQAEQSE